MAARSKHEIDIVVVYNEPDTLANVFLRSTEVSAARLSLIENLTQPRGLPTLFNLHKRTSTADWIIFCHQDFIVSEPGWLDRVRGLKPDACYGPIGVNSGGELLGRIIQTDGSPLGEPTDMADVVALDEMCVIVPRPIYSSVDFDERFPFDFYVHDYCQSALRAGFYIRVVDLHCQHQSKSLTGDATSDRYLTAKGRFLEKHRDSQNLRGLFNIAPKYINPVAQSPILTAVATLVPARSSVLVLGTDSGHLIHALTKRGCDITVVVADARLAKHLRPFCRRLLLSPLETLHRALRKPDQFDVVLIHGRLERVADPLHVISRIMRHLAFGGIFVVSVPQATLIGGLGAACAASAACSSSGPASTPLTFRSLGTLFQKHGFRLTDVRRYHLQLDGRDASVDLSRTPISVLRRLAMDPDSTTYHYTFCAVLSADDSTSQAPSSHSEAGRQSAVTRGLLAEYCHLAAWYEAQRPSSSDAAAVRRLALRALVLRPGFKSLVYLLLSVVPTRRLRRSLVGLRRPPAELEEATAELTRLRRLGLAVEELRALIPSGSRFIVVDQQEWDSEVLFDRQAIPFLERNGQYWGLPADDETAIRELERLRQSGADFMVFGWPAFWWFDYYSNLHRHLRANFRCFLENDRVVAFDLRR